MRCFVPDDPKWIRALKQWVSKPTTLNTIRDIERWADTLDTDSRGELSAFFEVAFPWQKARQADLVLAFRDRLAVCEVKNLPGDEVSRQLHSFLEKLERLQGFLKGALVNQGIRFLSRRDPEILFYCPGLDLSDIQKIKSDLHDLSHDNVGIAGEPKANYTHEYNLLDVLKKQLRSAQIDGHLSAADQLKSIIKQRLASFPDLESLSTFLRQNLDGVHNLISKPWYLDKLRSSDYERLKESLKTVRFVDVVSVPGLGKSELIKHYIRNRERDCFPVSPGDARSVDKFLQHTFRAVTDADPSGLGRTKLIEELDSKDIVIWVESYPIAAANSIREFVREVTSQGKTAPARDRTVWIFESIYPLDVAELPSLKLQPLRRSDIAAILNRMDLPRDVDVATIAAMSSGNPGTAVRMTQSKFLRLSDNHCDYFLESLSKRARALLDLLVLLDSNAPLGFTKTLFVRAAESAFQNLNEHLESDITRLIDDLDTFGFASVIHVDASQIDPTAENLFASLVQPITFVQRINQGLVDRVRRDIKDKTKSDLLSAIQDGLVSGSRIGNDLSEVTFALISGDIWPFFRSSFRHTNTHVESVLEWILANPYLRFKPGQDYLVKSLEILLQLKTLGESANEFPLERPDPSNLQQCCAYDVVRARWRERMDTKPDFAEWRKWADTCSDKDLRVEITIRLAEVLLRNEQYGQVWGMLNELLQEHAGASEAARGLLYWHVFAFLNRKKDAHLAGLDDRAIGGYIRR